MSVLALYLAVLGIGLYLQYWVYFITIEGLNMLGLILYHSITLFQLIRYSSGHGLVLPFESLILEILFISTMAFSLTLPAYFWTFSVFLQAPITFFNTFSYLKTYQMFAYHLPLMFVLPEIFVTRNLVNKFYVISRSD